VLRIGIGYAFLIGAILMGLLTYPLQNAISQMVFVLFEERTIAPISTALAIIILVNLYTNTGMVLEVQEFLRSVLKRQLLLFSLLPAILGLLPTGGAALLSAPFVNSEGEIIGMERSRRVYLNVWFRHTLVIAYPLTNMFILTIMLTNVSPIELVMILIPVTIIMFSIGYVIGLSRFKTRMVIRQNVTGSPLSLMPLLAAISLGIIFLRLIGIWGILFGALAGITTILLLKRPNKKKIVQSMNDRKLLMVALLLYSAMLFRSYVMGSKIPEVVGSILFIPHPALEILISIFIGFFLGYPSTAIAIAFSLFAPTGHLSVTTTFLIFSSAFLGYLISPFHLCIILTVEYMKGELLRTYKYLFPSFLLTIGFIVVYYTLIAI
jgi:hypothetical protein